MTEYAAEEIIFCSIRLLFRKLKRRTENDTGMDVL